MKKLRTVLLVTVAVLLSLYVIGRATNAFQYFSAPSGSNEPTYKQGSHLFASNLLSPKRFDFICYKAKDPTGPNEPEKQSMFMHRLCGLPGDTIEIREGDLFVNGVNQDHSLNLKKMYSIPRSVAAQLDLNENEVIPINDDSVIAPLETIQQADIIKKSKRFIRPGDEVSIKTIFGHSWTIDNFGPYIVPPNTYFVLGDNRNLTLDSRYIGPIKKQDYVATVIK